MNTATPTRTPTEVPAGAGAGAARLHVVRDGPRSVVRSSRSCLPIGLRQLRDAQPPGTVGVAIVQTGAMLVAGDDVSLNVEVGPGAALVLRDISATLAHPMALGGPDACQRLHVVVAAGASFVLQEEPLVIAAGARLRREVLIELEGDAVAVHSEILVLGRYGEPAGTCRARTRVTRDGTAVLDDTLAVGALAQASSSAVIGAAGSIATTGTFGVAESGRAPQDAMWLGPRDFVVRRLIEPFHPG